MGLDFNYKDYKVIQVKYFYQEKRYLAYWQNNPKFQKFMSISIGYRFP